MTGLGVRAFVLIGALVLGSQAALAEASTPAALPQNQQEVDARLKSFDPAATAAAQHYYNSPMVKNGILSMISSLTPAIINNMSQKEAKTFTDADRAKVAHIVDQAMRQNFDYLIGLNMVVALQTFSKDELQAMDGFYSSQTGQAILAKMPVLSKSMPGIMQSFMPKYIASVNEDMKAEGVGGK